MAYTKTMTITVKNDTSKFDDKVKEASKILSSFAIQTHVSVVQGVGVSPEVLYTAVLFYNGD